MNFISISAIATLLSAFVAQPAPWTSQEANSEQRQPVYLGASPRELALGLRLPDRPELPTDLRALGESHLGDLARALRLEAFQVEAWPARDDQGRLTWAWARWRADGASPWQWLDSTLHRGQSLGEQEPYAFLPIVYRPWRKKDYTALFVDFLLLKDLYSKPVFGDCVWTDETGDWAQGAWLPLAELGRWKEEFTRETRPGKRSVCHVLPQPARFNGAAVSWVVTYRNGQARWPSELRWRAPSAPELTGLRGERRILDWPSDFHAAYQRDVTLLTGEAEAVFPLSRRKIRFRRKNNAERNHQLEEMVDYLQERYTSLGLRRQYRHRFRWRDQDHSNLIVVIPGTEPASTNRPVLVADHIDTAFCQDVFDTSGRRVSTGGADDNVTAVAGLLRAAEIFKDRRPRHDLWLVHLTGEEFPADDLGARRLVSDLLAGRLRVEGRTVRDIAGLVLMDMIGYRPQRSEIFQINPGASAESLRIARIALDAAKELAPPFRAVLRPRYDARSYLYNTDGLIFSESGFPVILLNEHINYLEHLDRSHYHESTDTTDQLDWDYAETIVKVAIETAARLAELE